MRYVPPAAADRHDDLEQVRRQGRDLQKAFRTGHPDAVALVRTHYRDADPSTFQLSDALLVIARFHGFESWPKLKAELDRATMERLVAAVQAGNLRRVGSLLRQRPELVHFERSAGDEHRALHYAVMARNEEMVRLLMQAGADPHAGIYPHRDATTAYVLARDRGYDEIVAALEEEERRHREAAGCANASVEPQHERLAEAIRRGEGDEAVRLLEEDPSLVQARDREGRTPLHWTAATLDLRVGEWLIEHGADVHARDFSGLTPLERAARAVDWRRPGSRDRFGPFARRLRSAGAELGPLSAAALGEAEWLRAVLSAHPEALRSTDALEGGPITVAVQHDRPEIVELLLDLGLDPDEATRVPGLDQEEVSRGMPLWHCAGSGNLAVAELLLRRGADPNAEVYASGSPVYEAFTQRDPRMIELFRRYGGAPTPITVGLFRHVDLAREYLAGGSGFTPPVSEVGEAGIRDLLWGGACGGSPEIVRMCLDRLDWPREDPRWFGILDQPLYLWNHLPGHWVKESHPLDRSTYPVCFGLILERCDPDIPGAFGARMLHRVAAAGDCWGRKVMSEAERVTFARLLLDAGARLDVRDDLLRSTPLGWAARWGRLELAQLLVERGAPVDEPDAEPWATPVAWAEKRGHADLARWLRSPGVR